MKKITKSLQILGKKPQKETKKSKKILEKVYISEYNRIKWTKRQKCNENFIFLPIYGLKIKYP